MTELSEKVASRASRLRKLYSAAIYDILNELGLPTQSLDIAIKPLARDAVLAGPAFTLGYGADPRTDEEFGDEEINTFSYFRRIPEGSVVAVAGPPSQCGYWGELMSAGARARGATGVVVDGAMRDGRLVLAMENWSSFCRTLTPVESKGQMRLHILNRPIAMSGSLGTQVRVAPGDWIFGDMDGVVVIPAERVDDVLERAETVSDVETSARNDIRAGEPVDAVFKKYGRL